MRKQKMAKGRKMKNAKNEKNVFTFSFTCGAPFARMRRQWDFS